MGPTPNTRAKAHVSLTVQNPLSIALVGAEVLEERPRFIGQSDFCSIEAVARMGFSRRSSITNSCIQDSKSTKLN